MALLMAVTFASSAHAIPVAEHLRKMARGVDNGYSGISQTQVSWMIAGGAVGAFIVVCLIVWGIWKWRKLIVRAWRPRDDNAALDQYYGDYKRPRSFMSENRSHMLFGGGIGHSRDPSVDTLEPPPPALAPSNTSLRRHVSERRQLVRESVLDEKHRQRVLAPENSTFFLDEDEGPAEQPKKRKGSADELKIIIPPAAQEHRGTFYFPPPPIPDSPEAAQNQSRFSWTSTNPDGKSIRSSMESEPARYRTVSSWVSHQATHAERTERKSDQLSVDTNRIVEHPTVSSPPTPAAFRHHPGAPVNFITTHTRLESKDLDRQL